MKVYIKTIHDDLPESETEYTAWQGFAAMGFKIVFYSSDEELKDFRPDDLLVGRISTINKILKEYDISIPEYDYPSKLSSFLGRKVWSDTLDSVIDNKDSWPVFVKPKRSKVFTGFVLKDLNNAPSFRKTISDEPVFCSEPIQFLAEWRVFVRYGNIVSVRPYKGDWDVHFDPAVIRNMVSLFRSAPAGYSLDVGVTEKGETLLAEVNDGYSLGSYGIDPVEYAKLLSASWRELFGIADECDIYHEKAEWVHRKRKD